MEKPWKSPPASGGPSITSSALLPLQMTCSTPLHFNLGMALSPEPTSAATTRLSLDLFYKNGFNSHMEQPSRPSLTTDFALSALKNSFSMSSLFSQTCNQPEGIIEGTLNDTPSAAAQQTPNLTARLQWERPFNSLTRFKERGTSRVHWRRSIGASPLSVKDTAALNLSGSTGQNAAKTDWLGNADYTFLMGCDLIESCRSLNGEISLNNGEIEHSQIGDVIAHSNANNDSVSKDCQKDIRVTTPDLHLKLQILRGWLKRMESKVPKLIMRPKWTKETLDRRIADYKRLKREVDAHSAEFKAVCQRCVSWNRRVGRLLENRYHRLLLRIFEWNCHLETLAKKPSEFWNRRRAADNSPDSAMELPCKHPRLDESGPPGINYEAGQVVTEKDGENCQLDTEHGLSPPQSPISSSVNKLKQPNSETENSLTHEPSSEKNVNDSLKKCFDHSDGSLGLANDSSEWDYSFNTSCMVDETDKQPDLSIRKKLSFESEESNASSMKSWDKYSSSGSVQSGDEFKEASISEASLPSSPNVAANLLEVSGHEYAFRSYKKQKGEKMVTEVELVASMSVDACPSQHLKPEACCTNAEVAHNREYDASSDLIIFNDETNRKTEVLETPGSGRRSATSTLNRTFVLPGGTELSHSSLVFIETSNRTEPQASLSISVPSVSSPALSISLADEASSTRYSITKVSLSPSPGLSSSGSTSKLRQGCRRLPARLHMDLNNITNPTRLSISVTSASSDILSSDEDSNVEAGSQRGGDFVKSSPLTCIADTNTLLPIIANPVAKSIAKSSPLKPTQYSTNASPHAANSDGELGLAHVDKISNFSEHAWDNYVDRYASVAYSEDPPDSESARQLLDFGEDYRNELDSLSDCPSSVSADLCGSHPTHLLKRSLLKSTKRIGILDRLAITKLGLLDSDSDIDDLVHVVEISTSQLTIAQNSFHKVLSSFKLESSQIAELVATCRTNFQCLNTIVNHLKMPECSENPVPSPSELKPVEELIEKWRELDGKVTFVFAEGLQLRDLQQKVQAVRNKLLEHESLLIVTGFDGDFQLYLHKIHQIKFQVEEEKEIILQVTADVHGCVENQSTVASINYLKEDVAGLYQMWERLVFKVSEKEALLEHAEETWKKFQEQLLNLKAEMARDQNKLKPDVYSKNDDHWESALKNASEPCENLNLMGNWKDIQSSIQCDSGISSGSDGEFTSLGEREKRLHSLRQLARKLETVLSPASASMMCINRTLDETQQDLMMLHHQLSQLSLTPAEALLSPSAPIPSPPVKHISVQTDPLPLIIHKKKKRRPVEPIPCVYQQSVTLYWLRIVKAVLILILALVTLLFAALVLEPFFCLYLDTFGSSLIMKMIYLEGPRPV